MASNIFLTNFNYNESIAVLIFKTKFQDSDN